jgi:hypothetical protein
LQPRIKIPQLSLPKKSKEQTSGTQSARRPDCISILSWSDGEGFWDGSKPTTAPKTARVWKNVAPPAPVSLSPPTSAVKNDVRASLNQSTDTTASKSRNNWQSTQYSRVQTRASSDEIPLVTKVNLISIMTRVKVSKTPFYIPMSTFSTVIPPAGSRHPPNLTRAAQTRGRRRPGHTVR